MEIGEILKWVNCLFFVLQVEFVVATKKSVSAADGSS